MTSLEKANNLGFIFITLKPIYIYIYISIHAPLSAACIEMFQFIQKSVFWPQYMYPKLSPFNGYSWCPLGKLSHLGLGKLTAKYASSVNCNAHEGDNSTTPEFEGHRQKEVVHCIAWLSVNCQLFDVNYRFTQLFYGTFKSTPFFSTLFSRICMVLLMICLMEMKGACDILLVASYDPPWT